jgi:hypothetical protein
MDKKKIELKIEELEERIAPTHLAPDSILIVTGVGAEINGIISPDGVPPPPPEVVVNGVLVNARPLS